VVCSSLVLPHVIVSSLLRFRARAVQIGTPPRWNLARNLFEQLASCDCAIKVLDLPIRKILAGVAPGFRGGHYYSEVVVKHHDFSSSASLRSTRRDSSSRCLRRVSIGPTPRFRARRMIASASGSTSGWADKLLPLDVFRSP
jgi:hypothetical protein